MLGGALSLQAAPLTPPIERELTSATGEKLNARIVDISEAQLTILRLPDQARFVFPVERLSAEDRGFVAALYQLNKERGVPKAASMEASRPPATDATETESSLPLPKPGFSRALGMLSQEKDTARLREAVEVVITQMAKQSRRTFPVHYVTLNVWQAVRRLPDQKAAVEWANRLLTAQLNDPSLNEDQRDAVIFMSLTRDARMLFTPEWRAAYEEFAKMRPNSSLIPTMEVAYASSRYRADRAEAKRHLTGLLTASNPELVAAARQQLAHWEQIETVGTIETWRFTAVDGREVDISKMRGKVVLVDFWATWCGPCVKEFPTLKKLHADYHDKGLEIVGIALENTISTQEAAMEKLRQYVKTHELTWPHYADGKGWKTTYAAAYGVNSIPRMVIIDRDGTVIDHRLRGEQLVARIEALLGAKAAK